ncbi:MAG: class F sortase [Nocardioidaceae bacterium]
MPGSRRVSTVVCLGAFVVLCASAAAVSAWPRADETVSAEPTADGSDPAASAATDGPAPEVAPAKRAGSVTPERPLTARLPSGRVVPIRAVSTKRDGTLDVPEDITTAGWWRGGSRVGDPFGSLLVAAHIDSRTQGLGPYSELLSVQRGDRVRVTSRHLVQEFTVRSLRLVPQGSLSRQAWIYSPSGPPRLTMVTCAPPYDARRGGYQNLVVVTAAPVAVPDPRAS